MYKKKISTIAIITLLTLSILIAAIPMASAITSVAVTGSPGNVGDKVTVSGIGATPFAPLEVYWDSLATKIKDGYALSDGTFSIANVVIPAGIVGDHDVIVKDTLSEDVKFATFTIESEIDVSPDQGLPGDSVTVEGTGFAGTTFMNDVDVRIFLGAYGSSTAITGSGTAYTLTNTPVVAGTETIYMAITAEVVGTGDGTTTIFNLDYDNVVPASEAVYLGGVLQVDDGSVYTLVDATGVITFVAAPAAAVAITADYDCILDDPADYSLVDATGAITLTVTAPGTVTADYEYADYEVTPSAGVTTSDVGSFSAVIIIPAIAVGDYGDYDVTAVDEDGNSAAYVTLTVDYYVTVDPTSGPTGITITIAGRIKANTAYELRFNVAQVATGTTDADGLFSNNYVIPTVLSTGYYAVTVVWEITESRTATPPEFTVTAPPQVVYAPTSGVAGAVVTISTVAGFPFSAGSNITLYLGTTVVNSTATDDRFGPTVAFGPAAGSFTDLEFTVPTLTPGPYALKVVDEYGASTAAIYTFTVLPTPVTTAALRGTTYYPCCTLSFNIVTTETDLGTITVTIRDPSGATWWTDTWTLSTDGASNRVLYQDQLVNDNPIKLPLDAPLGSWNWTITYTLPIPTKATGLFTVAAQPTMQTVLDQLDTMEASIKSVVTTSEGKIIVAVNTKAGEIITDLDALGAKLQGIEDLGVVIATDVDEIQIDLAALDLTVLDALGIDITSIKGDVATIKSNIGTVTTNVATLDAKVTSLSGDVATVSTTLGTLTGTVTSIEGDIATIDTEVGTLQADIADIDLDVDMTPAWIAVVLSLVAAIAAVFAVITIRQKIAG